MKVLLIGMDGAHQEIFERGWTPKISKIIQNHQQLSITNDLISRGWLEIVLGKHAKTTSALYDKPKSNQSLAWNNKFSLPDVPGINSTIKTLWEKLNTLNVSTGIINVPTTFPAPKVNGFFISGGGGGAPVTGTATSEHCFPPEIIDTLNKNKYIVDERLDQLVIDKSLNTAEQILSRLAEKNRRRTKTFLELNDKYDVDFGLIIYKTSSITTETLLKSEYRRQSNPSNHADEQLIEAVRDYYQKFDNEIAKLHDANPNAEIILVSDHGVTQRKYSINPNILLQEHGLQKIQNDKNLRKWLISKARGIIPYKLKVLLRRSVVKNYNSSTPINFDQKSTMAFCKTIGDWCHGIYINDFDRFGGPVQNDQFEKIRKEIIKIINSNVDSQKHGISAKSTAEKNETKQNDYPDIQLSIPSEYQTYDKSSEYISEFKAPRIRSTLDAILKGHILSKKSHHPLAYMSKDLCSKFSSDELQGDLTVIHNRILDIFRNSNSK